VVRFLEVVVEAGLSSAECSHLAGEVSDLLPQGTVARGWINASERRLGFDVGDAVRTEGCGLQVVFVLAGEEALYIAGQPAGPDASDDIVRHVWCETPEVSQELGRLAIANFLDREELPDALFR
jgi:hypothetical protein